LLLSSETESAPKKRRFRFQEQWCSTPKVNSIVGSVWKEPFEDSAIFVLFQKLKKCHHKIVEWQRFSGSNSKKQIDEIKQKLLEAKNSIREDNKVVIEALES
ncbi:hypothetical protein PIB30_097798, partial [Stylosanthes scabra]|nr:hypothetical protein [Stylosanthes scabra]